MLNYGASGGFWWFCLPHGGFLGTLCVLPSDASLHDWALAHSFWPRETVAQVGRTLERSRIRRVGPHSARESAVISALLEVKIRRTLATSRLLE